jgi:hypothetical protein
MNQFEVIAARDGSGKLGQSSGSAIDPNQVLSDADTPQRAIEWLAMAKLVAGPYGRGAGREGYPSTATAPNWHRIVMPWEARSRRNGCGRG